MNFLYIGRQCRSEMSSVEVRTEAVCVMADCLSLGLLSDGLGRLAATIASKDAVCRLQMFTMTTLIHTSKRECAGLIDSLRLTPRYGDPTKLHLTTGDPQLCRTVLYFPVVMLGLY